MSEENHTICAICGIYSDAGNHHQPWCEPIRDLQTRVTALETPVTARESEEHKHKEHKERKGH